MDRHFATDRPAFLDLCPTVRSDTNPLVVFHTDQYLRIVLSTDGSFCNDQKYHESPNACQPFMSTASHKEEL